MATIPKVKDWRGLSDYRKIYFKSKPGLFGILWFCSQCGIPLIGKKRVHVDHVFPPSKVAKKKYNRKGELISNTSFRARMFNTRMNTVAACAPCNLKKSAKVGMVTVKGYLAMIAEMIYFTVYKVGVYLLAFSLVASHKLLSTLWRAYKSLLVGKSFKQKVIVLGITAAVLILLYLRLFKKE